MDESFLLSLVILINLLFVIIIAVPLIVLYSKHRELKEQVLSLKDQLLLLRQTQQQNKSTVADHTVQPEMDREMDRERVKTEPEQETVQQEGIQFHQPDIPATSPLPTAEEARSHDAPAQRSISEEQMDSDNKDWEWLIGGRWLNRIGALALIFGMAFFLKYAIDQNWISEGVRVVIGAVTGAALLVGGARSHRKGYEIFSQGLVGAGLAVLQLAVYASFQFYQLIPQAMALVLMSLVTVLAFQQAIRYNAMAISLLGWIGGFLTPFLLSTGEENVLGLFSYILLLVIGLLAVLLRKPEWKLLYPLTMGATYLIFLGWLVVQYEPYQLGLAITFSFLYWGLFLVYDLYSGMRASRSDILYTLSSVGSVTWLYFVMLIILHPVMAEGVGSMLLLLTAVYYGCDVMLQKRGSLFTHYFWCGTGLAFATTPVFFTQYGAVTMWAVEGVLLIIGGMVIWRKVNTWIPAFIAFGLSALWLLGLESTWGMDPASYRFLFHLRSLGTLLLVAALIFAAVILRKYGQTGKKMTGVLVSAMLLLFLWMTVEVTDLFSFLIFHRSEQMMAIQSLRYTGIMVLVILWWLYAAICITVGMKKQLPVGYYGGGVIGLVSLLVLMMAGLGFPLEQYTFFFNIRTLATVCSLAGLLLLIRLVRTQLQQKSATTLLLTVTQVLLVGVLLGWMTVETYDLFSYLIQFKGGSDALVHALQLTLSLLWLFFSLSLLAIGIWRRLRSFRLMAMSLFALSILKIFLYDLAFLELLFRIFSFMGLGIVLLLVSFVYQKYKDHLV
ncbi:DUF2339 domain-containing protein [Mechercharimyces sp. CAU 1602]|uniref:DUF2339 domain-containing protein n=1 Tax=Mechercharimyces sp. CAU 1602 TaxID=2973933 RepID=UPI00216276F5|nr:DUF2339 domain-containing protein [Mechercharimyces sp. CAU 1602]MCS1350204.1 DUF2339 domain-containing protein [Mechercharimyces sp. CAU 1602]